MEPKIQVSQAIAKKIAQIICKEIKQSFSDNKTHYDLCKRSMNQYNQITKWMELGKECNKPWNGAADYFIGLTEWVIDAVWSRVLSILFSQEPFMQAKGVESSDVPKQDGVTDFVDMVFRDIIHVQEASRFFFKQILILPFAVAKYDWHQRFDTMIVKETAQVFTNQATGQVEHLLPDNPEALERTAFLIANSYQMTGSEDVWVAEDKELYNAPKFKYIAHDDYVFSQYAKRGERLFWEGDRFWMTLNEMVQEVKQEKFNKESVDSVKREMKLDSMQSNDAIIAQKSKPIECFHWYGRLPFNEQNQVDFENPDAIEQEVYCCVSYNEEELLSIYYWPYRRVPYPDRVYLRGEFEETEEFQGRSLAQKLYMTQKELNTLHNTIMNNAMIAMQKIFVKRRSLQGNEWDRPEIYPGAIWEEDMPGEIRALEVGDVKMVGLELEQTLLNFAERISNISVFQTGTAHQGGQKTLGEVEKTIQEGNIGIDKYIQNCHSVFRKICQWTVDYYYDRIPPGLERRILGDKGEMIFPTPENIALYSKKGVKPTWQQDDLAGKFDFIWNGGSLNSSKEWRLAVANDMMEKYLPHPMIAGNLLATWEILKEGLIARGKKDWQTILPPREAILKEMQLMQKKVVVDDVKKKIMNREEVNAGFAG